MKHLQEIFFNIPEIWIGCEDMGKFSNIKST